MAIEIEAKMRVSDLSAVRARVEGCGGSRLASVFEVNTFFDTPTRALLAADQGLRLRTARRLPDGAPSFVITFKGPRLHGALKSREETELQVADGAAAAALLQCLGFQSVLSFEKRRESWRVDACQVELDELPLLGVFVEIEGPDEPAVMRVRERLGLDRAALERSSYIALLMSHLQEHGLRQRAVTFADAL